MCQIITKQYTCGCECREEVDCEKFAKQRRKGLPFWKMLPRVRALACLNTKYSVASRPYSCQRRECPKRKRHVSKIPVVLKDTARGTTGFLYSGREPAPEPPVKRRVPAPAPAPVHHKERANVRDQMKPKTDLRERGHDAPRRENARAPPAAKEPPRERRDDKACDLRRTNGHHLPKQHEGTHADPRRRHADRLAQKIELPKVGNVPARREGATITRPAHRVASQHGVLECATPPRAHRSDRQRSHHVQEPARPRHKVTDSWYPPVDIPARPKAPIHDYHRQRRHHPISRNVTPAFRQRDSRTRIPEPANSRRHGHVIAPPTNQRPPTQARRTAAPAPVSRHIPTNHNPMFAKKRETVPAPKETKKKGLRSRISNFLGLQHDNDSELSFSCVGLPPEPWRSDSLIMNCPTRC
ncbi:hypothetical protein V8F33_007654 [Rhypophila sp. PSN 637]